MNLHYQIKTYCDTLTKQFDEIPNERRAILQKISMYMQLKQDQDLPIHLVYICTHNSRRSHFGQVWGAVAAAYYKVKNVSTYSGGTEATAFNPNAIAALQRIGFAITHDGRPTNPVYNIHFGDGLSVTCFSKVYSDEVNPKTNFAAIMTCSDAEENCPFIPGVELRIGTTYDDPKAFDGTELQNNKYDERCRQIALETLYAFSLIN
ncbi:MAG: protein-tyrosine-phosphatase [Bacteroidia bacterium]|jgi:protein-tyrosine phosphatase/arsenate reductase|nr:protein-tyrosine-phosphatase [Bacteroidia bacterium]